MKWRPQKRSKSDEQFIKVTYLRNRKKTSQQLAQDLRDASGPSVDSSAVCRSLIRNGLNGSMAVRKPFQRKGNWEKRVQCAKNHKTGQKISGKMSFGVMNPNFEIFGSHRRQYVRRRPGERYNSECLQPSIKHGGGSVMVLGCVSASSAGDIVKIDGIMNAEKYRQLLLHHALHCHLGSVSLAMASYFSMTMIPNTLLMQLKYIYKQKKKMVRYQYWIGLSRRRASTSSRP